MEIESDFIHLTDEDLSQYDENISLKPPPKIEINDEGTLVMEKAIMSSMCATDQTLKILVAHANINNPKQLKLLIHKYKDTKLERGKLRLYKIGIIKALSMGKGFLQGTAICKNPIIQMMINGMAAEKANNSITIEEMEILLNSKKLSKTQTSSSVYTIALMNILSAAFSDTINSMIGEQIDMSKLDISKPLEILSAEEKVIKESKPLVFTEIKGERVREEYSGDCPVTLLTPNPSIKQIFDEDINNEVSDNKINDHIQNNTFGDSISNYKLNNTPSLVEIKDDTNEINLFGEFVKDDNKEEGIHLEAEEFQNNNSDINISNEIEIEFTNELLHEVSEKSTNGIFNNEENTNNNDTINECIELEGDKDENNSSNEENQNGSNTLNVEEENEKESNIYEDFRNETMSIVEEIPDVYTSRKRKKFTDLLNFDDEEDQVVPQLHVTKKRKRVMDFNHSAKRIAKNNF